MNHSQRADSGSGAALYPSAWLQQARFRNTQPCRRSVYYMVPSSNAFYRSLHNTKSPHSGLSSLVLFWFVCLLFPPHTNHVISNEHWWENQTFSGIFCCVTQERAAQHVGHSHQKSKTEKSVTVAVLREPGQEGKTGLCVVKLHCAIYFV